MIIADLSGLSRLEHNSRRGDNTDSWKLDRDVEHQFLQDASQGVIA